MNPDDLIFIGLKASVAALLKSNGMIVWSTELDSGIGSGGFVTLVSEEHRIYAYARGSAYCLDALTGQIIWTNGLKGYGFGIGSLCLPNSSSAPPPPLYAQLESEQRASAASTASQSS